MTKLEQKLIAFVEKHMLLLSVVIVSVIALLIRRQAIWYYAEDYIYYFDMHPNNVQSAFYYLIVRLCGYVFYSPLHGIKWIACIADFGVAFLCVLFCKRKFRSPLEDSAKRKLLFVYAFALFAPVMYLYGAVWAKTDSLAMLFILFSAYILWYGEGKNKWMAVVAAGIGMALYPPYLPIAAGVFLCREQKGIQKKVMLCVSILFAVALQAISGLILDSSLTESLTSFVRWMSYHPYTGELYGEVSDWLWHMLLQYGYGIGLLSGIGAFNRKISPMAATVVHLILTLCCGIALGW